MVDTIPKLESHISKHRVDPISFHERNEATHRAVEKIFEELTVEELSGYLPKWAT